MKINISAEEYTKINLDYWNEILYYVVHAKNERLEEMIRKRLEMLEFFNIKKDEHEKGH